MHCNVSKKNKIWTLHKFIYSEKAKNFCEISTLLLTTVQSGVRWRFCKFLWPTQNIWTLTLLVSNYVNILMKSLMKFISFQTLHTTTCTYNAVLCPCEIQLRRRKGSQAKTYRPWKLGRETKLFCLDIDKGLKNIFLGIIFFCFSR